MVLFFFFFGIGEGNQAGGGKIHPGVKPMAKLSTPHTHAAAVEKKTLHTQHSDCWV